MSSKERYDYYNEMGEKAPIAELMAASPQGKWREDFLRPYLESWKGLTLDLGCNKGFYKKYIKNYVGLEISHDVLNQFKGNRVKGVIQRLPFKDDVFNNILLSETLEHVPEHQQVINECARVLKKVGEIMVTVPYGDDPFREMDFPILKRYGMKKTSSLHGGFNSSHLRKLFDEAGLYLEACERLAPLRIYAYGFKR